MEFFKPAKAIHKQFSVYNIDFCSYFSECYQTKIPRLSVLAQGHQLHRTGVSPITLSQKSPFIL